MLTYKQMIRLTNPEFKLRQRRKGKTKRLMRNSTEPQQWTHGKATCTVLCYQKMLGTCWVFVCVFLFLQWGNIFLFPQEHWPLTIIYTLICELSEKTLAVHFSFCNAIKCLSPLISSTIQQHCLLKWVFLCHLEKS